jgi:DNA-binding response OmpR family regulator
MSVNHPSPSPEEYPYTHMILIVEDDPAIGAFLAQAITQETSYHPLLVPDGFAALKVIHDMVPNLLLLDYQLPGMNGIELYDRLHAMEKLQDVPAILISAYLPQREVQKRRITSLRKPFELDELLQTIETMLDQ